MRRSSSEIKERPGPRQPLPDHSLVNPCPVCGDVRIDGGVLRLVVLDHTLLLASEGHVLSGEERAAAYGEDYAGPGYLLEGGRTLRVDLGNAADRLCKAFRERVLSSRDREDPTVLVIAPASVARSELEVALARLRRGEG